MGWFLLHAAPAKLTERLHKVHNAVLQADFSDVAELCSRPQTQTTLLELKQRSLKLIPYSRFLLEQLAHGAEVLKLYSAPRVVAS
jgi:hypothetical protein